MEPIKKSFYRLFYPENGTKVSGLQEYIYFTTTYPPPTRIEPTIKKLCCIKWDLVVDVLSLPTRTNSLGKVYYILNYEIDMMCSGSSIDFAVIYFIVARPYRPRAHLNICY